MRRKKEEEEEEGREGGRQDRRSITKSQHRNTTTFLKKMTQEMLQAKFPVSLPMSTKRFLTIIPCTCLRQYLLRVSYYKSIGSLFWSVKFSPSSLIPHPTSLIPHPSSHIPHPSSLIPHPSSHTPHLIWLLCTSTAQALSNKKGLLLLCVCSHEVTH